MTHWTRPRTVAILQARLGSTRLPGKVRGSALAQERQDSDRSCLFLVAERRGCLFNQLLRGERHAALLSHGPQKCLCSRREYRFRFKSA